MASLETLQLTAGGWFDGLPPNQSATLHSLLSEGKTEEEIGELWLAPPGTSNTAGFGAISGIPSFYTNVKREFVAFVCGDARYDPERAQALQIWNSHGKVGLVSTVAAVVASTLGLAVAAVVPVVALLFSLMAKVGLNAFCASCSATNDQPAPAAP